jgi:purine-binding chemotaxis protein CheW
MRKRPAAELTPATRPRGPVAETRQSGMNRELHIVGFQIGRETYGVPITSLHEIVRVPEITAVPDAPDYMEGVINLRGKIVSVIDLRKRLGAKEVVSSRRNRILVVEHNGRLCGLMVDSASEVLKVPTSDIEPSSAVFQDGGLNCVTGLGKYRGRLIVLLDMARLLEYSGVRPTSKGGENTAALPATTGEAHGAAGGR